MQIGDSFSEGEVLQFTGIPYFAPDFFRSVRIRNPIKVKHLHKGLQQLGEEGAVQVFKPVDGGDLILARSYVAVRRGGEPFARASTA